MRPINSNFLTVVMALFATTAFYIFLVSLQAIPEEECISIDVQTLMDTRRVAGYPIVISGTFSIDGFSADEHVLTWDGDVFETRDVLESRSALYKFRLVTGRGALSIFFDQVEVEYDIDSQDCMVDVAMKMGDVHPSVQSWGEISRVDITLKGMMLNPNAGPECVRPHERVMHDEDGTMCFQTSAQN